MANPIRVKVANGAILKGTEILSNCEWSCQGAHFSSSMKVIPLQCYDVILGIEWPQTHSPMEVDWNSKWIVVKQGDTIAKLHGITADTSSCKKISWSELAATEQNGSILYILQVTPETPKHKNPIAAEIQHLLVEFADLFEEPKGCHQKGYVTTKFLNCRVRPLPNFGLTGTTLCRKRK